jgi:hypothetical protein
MESNVNFTCRISPALLERVRTEARRNRRTVGAELMVLLEDGLTARHPVTRATDPMPLAAEDPDGTGYTGFNI